MHRSTEKSRSEGSKTPKPYIQFPKEPITLDRLPLQIGKNITVEYYNTYLRDRESTAYKLERDDNGDVFIVEMPLDEHEAIAWYIDTCFMRANGANPPNKLPICIKRATIHRSPTRGHNIEPDCSFAPHPSFVRVSPLNRYPGPPPSNHNGNPYARIVCEIGNAQSTTSVWKRCQDWMRQRYVRYAVGLKFHDPRTSRNALGQFNRSMTARVYCQPGAPPPVPQALVTSLCPPPATVSGPIPLVPGYIIPGAAPPPVPYFLEWEFGTHHPGPHGRPTACTSPNLPAFQIEFPTSEIFWDPPLPKDLTDPFTIPTVPTGYIAKIPTALDPMGSAPATNIPAGFFHIARTINIDLFFVQDIVLQNQDNI